MSDVQALVLVMGAAFIGLLLLSPGFRGAVFLIRLACIAFGIVYLIVGALR